MKVNTKVIITEKHGQYYARWRSDEIVTNENGNEKRREYFEPTYVAVPSPGSPAQVVERAKKLARDASEYMAELVSPHRPSGELQQIKLAEFAVRSADIGKESIREFFPLYLIDYSLTPDKDGKLPLKDAVRTMRSTLHRVLDRLHGDRALHPSSIPTGRLQSIVDSLCGQQERHVINLRCAYRYGVEKGMVLKTLNPAEGLKAKSGSRIQRIPAEQAVIQRGLNYMANIKDGEQWRILTVTGVYTPMRIGTACKLQIKPANFVKPEKPRKCSFLDMSKHEWKIEFYDTKGGKWEIQILHPAYVSWLAPYILKHKLGPGDYVLPNFARLSNPPSVSWERIMEKSGYPMQYAVVNEHKICLTGFHSLRISSDKWAKENEEAELSREDIESGMLRHTRKVHRSSYDSGAINVAQQRRINASRPTFLPGTSDATVALLELRKRKHILAAELQAINESETELCKFMEKDTNDTKANEAGSAAAA